MMVRSVVAWCDYCMEVDAAQEPGTEVVVQLDYGNPTRIDLCDRHTKELVTPLADLLRNHGVTAEPSPGRALRTVTNPAPAKKSARKKPAKKKAATGATCLVPDCASGGTVFKNANSMFAHVSQAHKMGRPAYRAKYLSESTAENGA